jgi:RNA polymerase sigma-70 factor, ECF subfamily
VNSTPETDKQRAFLALYEPVHARLLRFCQARVFNRSEVKDIAAETVLRDWEQFEKLRDERAFLGFLFGIALRVVREKERSKRWWGLFSQEKAETTPSDDASPETHADIRLLHDALRHLPAVQQEAVVLHEIAGLSLAEIATVQEVSLSAVKSRVARGRSHLAQLLGAVNQPEKLSATNSLLCQNEA